MTFCYITLSTERLQIGLVEEIALADREGYDVISHLASHYLAIASALLTQRMSPTPGTAESCPSARVVKVVRPLPDVCATFPLSIELHLALAIPW